MRVVINLKSREKNLSHGPLEDQTLSERAPCLNKLKDALVHAPIT